MRVIVFGAGGQLGTDLVRECRKRGHSNLALRREKLDIADAAAVLGAIERYQPHWVINAAAYNKVDLAETEPAAAMRINAVAVHDIAAACLETGAALLHYSTDHVFRGDKETPYSEEDRPHPASAYAISKLAGEFFVQGYCEKQYVIRVAGVFGPAGRYTPHGNFPELILRKAAEGAALRVVKDFIAAPTYGPALASRSLDLLEKKIPYGLYHLTGGEALSWYDYAVKIAEAAGKRADIAAVTRREYPTAAKRPRYAALATAKIEAAGIAPIPALDDCLKEYMDLRKRERPRGGFAAGG